MAKKKPTQEYLNDLINEESVVREDLKQATQDLYKYTATAKIGNPDFEAARQAVLEGSRKIIALAQEIERVHDALLKLPELPFED